jgi:hypothetical protein
MKRKLPADYNPVTALRMMPIDMLESVVDALEENERKARERRILYRIRKARREMDENILKKDVKGGRNVQSHSSK